MDGIFERGNWEVFRYRGVPVRVHWTTLLGAFVFGGMSFSPAFWAAFLTLVLLHEAGHAWVVRRLGHRVMAIHVTGFGGMCRWSGAASLRQRGMIAWGGVLAQALLLLATLIVVAIFGWPTATWASHIASAFIYTNAILIGLNLLPVEPLDGAEAWAFVRAEWRRRRSSPAPPPRAPRAPAPRPARPDSVAAADLARRLEEIARAARDARR